MLLSIYVSCVCLLDWMLVFPKDKIIKESWVSYTTDSSTQYNRRWNLDVGIILN